MQKLTKETYLIYAAKNYLNPICTSISDFERDCKKFIVARTLMRNYYKKGKLRIRLLINHVIICTNTFGNEPAVKLFFYHCEKELWPCLVALFDFLNILPEDIKIEPDTDIQKMLEDE